MYSPRSFLSDPWTRVQVPRAPPSPAHPSRARVPLTALGPEATYASWVPPAAPRDSQGSLLDGTRGLSSRFTLGREKDGVSIRGCPGPLRQQRASEGSGWDSGGGGGAARASAGAAGPSRLRLGRQREPAVGQELSELHKAGNTPLRTSGLSSSSQGLRGPARCLIVQSP